MTYYIGSARHDENGKYTGGKAGDQTGNEVATQKMYNYPSKGGWICYRFKNPKHGEATCNAMMAACANNNIGYSQSQRYQIIGKGVNVATPVNCDCSSLTREVIRVATGIDLGDFTTLSAHDTFMRSGLIEKVGAVTTLTKGLCRGDIICTAKKGHIAVITSGESRYTAPATTPVVNQADAKKKAIIAAGQQHSINFTGIRIATDGIRGAETRQQAVAVIQNACNLDYGAGLDVDGVWGGKTDAAIRNHWVKRGETQYLVTAAEILCMLKGIDPNGVECPGVFGKGLQNATGQSKLTASWFYDMTQN